MVNVLLSDKLKTVHRGIPETLQVGTPYNGVTAQLGMYVDHVGVT